MVLACQSINIWAVIQPDQPDLINTARTATQLIDLADLLVNSSLQLIEDDGNDEPFVCTNDPFADYYSLTKNLNVVELVDKVTYNNKLNLYLALTHLNKIMLSSISLLKINQLMQNQLQNISDNFSTPSIECLEIDSVYRKFSILNKAFANDTTGIIKAKMNCFKNSIFLPYNSYIYQYFKKP